MAEKSETTKNLTNSLNNLKLHSKNNVNGLIGSDLSENSDGIVEKWGFPLFDLYKLGLRFYKGI